MVIPSLAGIPLVIECDTSTERILTTLMKMGCLKPDDEVDERDPAMTGFEAMLEKFPVLKRADDWGDSVMLCSDDDRFSASLYSRTYDQVIYIKPVVDELLKLNDPELMNWFGQSLHSNGGVIGPGRWIEWVQELGGEPMENDNGELLPSAPDDKIGEFIASLGQRYPYLISPTPSITNEQARDRLAVSNAELAGILYPLTNDTAGFNEAYAVIGLEPSDYIFHGIERIREYEMHGGSEPMEDPFYESVESLEKLPETFAKWEALLTPIDNLNTYANRLNGNAGPKTDPSDPDLLVRR